MTGGDDDLRARSQALETLLREMEEGPESPTRARARQIVRATLDLHARALTRMLEIVAAEAPAGSPLVEALARDPLVAGVLLLHGLHPLDLESRVRGAVESVNATLRGQGAEVALVAVGDDAVRLRIERWGRPGLVPLTALRTRVEEAVLALAPDAPRVELQVPDETPPAVFVPLDRVRLRGSTERRG